MKINVEQLKKDVTRGVSISRVTWMELLCYAEQLERTKDSALEGAALAVLERADGRYDISTAEAVEAIRACKVTP